MSDTITMGASLLTGSKIDTFYNNASNCFYRATNLTFYDIPPYLEKMNDGSRDMLTKISDTTNITQVVSNGLWVCNSFLKNFVNYQNTKIPTFGGFTTLLTSFFQNLLSNALSINNIY